MDNQGNGLKAIGHQVTYYHIIGKGIMGYLKHVFLLRKHLKTHHYDVIHGHYAFSGITAALAGSKPLVVSIMGSDIYMSQWIRKIVLFMGKFLWKHVIVKSERMRNELNLSSAIILPNGVDLNHFAYRSDQRAMNKIWPMGGKHIIWVSDPDRKEKQFELACAAFQFLPERDAELHVVNRVSADQLPLYYSAAKVLLLTSAYEGSPNVVKEAMACGLPVVSTDVGDVRDMVDGVAGCFVCRSSPVELALGIEKAFLFGGRTRGRAKMRNYDMKRISRKLVNIYQSVIKHA